MTRFAKFLLILVILTTLGNLVNQVILWAPPIVDSETAGGNSGSGSSGNLPGGGTGENTGDKEEEEKLPIADVQISATVTPDADGKVPAGGVSINGVTASATVPEGVQMEDGATELTLTVNGKEDSEADLDLGENEVSTSLDVHMAGVSTDNAVPMEIKLAAAAVKGLNSTSIKLYHVENGETIEMTRVANGEDFTEHNQFKYAPATGDVTLYMASFSEVAVVADTANEWDGTRDYSWYTNNSEGNNYVIANAEQLAAFGAIVGEMAKTADGVDIAQDSFAGKTVKLVADIDLGDNEENNREEIIFYPIGYWNNEGTYERKPLEERTTPVSSGFYTFEGTFDGNGHTIENFYQNTWEMKGDHDWYDTTKEQYFRDGMGLFGRLYKATVKNLTVKNFKSDGEITTTGTIAAYAEGTTFENIAIFNCNPRVYNIGNGGIVGCVGWYAKEADLKTTFTNITVDNTNKISALWGSYDVACGGIVGQYYPTSGQTSAGTLKNAGIEFTNCHVSAIMDVYNDVCANYQYYAYRYTGMLIGSVRENETIDGRVYPKMDGITAKDCTVHYGDWNDYYYCELVANSLASYTHDHQMSRLTQVKSVDVANKTVTDLDGNTTAIPTSSRVNYVVVKAKGDDGKWIHGDGHDYAECYHFVNGVQHFHDVADADNPNPTETVGGVEGVLKEDKQLIYREFNNLVTGYGWGVTTKGVDDVDGVTILEREEGNSAKKFESNVTELANNKEYKFSDIFAFVNNSIEIKPGALNVAITNLDENDPVSATIVYDKTTWENGTITFAGKGSIQITIQDYYFCTPTTINVNVTERQAEKKFDIVMNNGDFLHRVGNSGTVEVGKLFKAKDGVTIGTVSVTIEEVDGTSANGTYTYNSKWESGNIQFSGTGVVKVTITDNNYCTPTVLHLEVVNAVNATGATDATSNNVVLLNNISGGFTVSGEYTVFGNGFTLNYTGNGQYLNNGLRQGVVTVSENGTLDNLRIVAPVYPKAYLYYGTTTLGDYVQGGPSSVEGDKTRYHYQLSAVVAKGNATISNCYIYGARTNIFVDTGDVTIKDTILECGTVANVQIQSTNEYTITLENVTTIQYLVDSNVPNITSVKMLGAGVLVGPDTGTNPTIVLNGEFKQYNWVTADDKAAVNDTIVQAIIQGALDATEYNHTINEKTASNLGIIYMNEADFTVTNNTELPYAKGAVAIKMSGTTVNGGVFSLQNAAANQIYSDYGSADKTTVNGDYIPTFEFDLGDQEISYDGSEDTRYLYGDKNGVTALYKDGESSLTLDLNKLATIYKYTGKNYNVTAVCKDSNGNTLTASNGVVTLSAQGSYTIEFTVEDNIFYNQNGVTITKSVTRTYTVPLTLTVKEADVKNAVVNITNTSLDGVYTTVNVTDYKLRINFLDCISITDYDNKGNGTTVTLSNNISSATLTPSGVNVFTTASTITITYTDGRVLTVNLSNISGSSPGTKTATINTSGGLYFITDGALNNKPTEASSQNKCTITSVSYKGNSGSTVTNDTDVTVTWALGSSGIGCVTGDTLVTLADGSQKRIDEITSDDLILVYDHYTGKMAVAPIAFYENNGVQEYEVVTLNFSNGRNTKLIYEHGYFDITLNKYVYIHASDAESFVGHEFAMVDAEGNIDSVVLESVDVSNMEIGCYSITSGYHYGFIADGMLSIPGAIEGLFNIFEYGENLVYDEEKMAQDIETYGLFTYEDFAAYAPEEAFEMFNAKYFKVSIGKGYVTMEEIIYMIETFLDF